jgi:putative MATE family efflux protein
MGETKSFSEMMRTKQNLSFKDKLTAVYHLSLPGILAQISEIVMEYIDAAMVGSLGASASASVGLVASTTWLFGGLINATAAGFSVQVAHAVGAGNEEKSKAIFKQSLFASLCVAVPVGILGALLALHLPQWLGADESIWQDATDYFLFFALFIPVRQINILCMNMLQCSGNMKTPSILAASMCMLDVVYNYFLIFPTRMVSVLGHAFMMPGAGMGVKGAQLGTCFAVITVMFFMFYQAAFREKALRLKDTVSGWLPQKHVIETAAKIGVPMALEQSATMGAMVVSTRIVAPLGTVAIAANSFAVTAESVCYMPGFGIASAATTMIGQAVGAQRKELAKSFAWLTCGVGIIVQSLLGLLMYFICPLVFQFLTPDLSVRQLGVQVLRIELFAEPLFAASIVASGALRGAGDTFVPGMMNLISIWCVRITTAYFLAQTMGLYGVWIAMTIELCFRGILLLSRLAKGRWLQKLLG